MNHNNGMTGEEWYNARNYIGPGRFGTDYERIRSPLELYPGHAAYSGTLWYELKPRNEKHQDAEPSGIVSILTPNAKKESDIVDDLLANKVDAMRQNIEHIAYQLEEREKLGKQNQYTIDLTMMKTQEGLFECELWPPGSNQSIEKRRSQLEKTLQELDREKRFEEISCWKDQQMLLRDMREASTEFDSAIRRKGLLNDSRLTGSQSDSVQHSGQMYAAGGLEGSKMPSGELQQSDATDQSISERHKGEAPVEGLPITEPERSCEQQYSG